MELEHLTQIQGAALQQFEREQDADETRPIGSMQSPAGPAPPEWMTRGYDGSVTPQESIAAHPLMTAAFLGSGSTNDRKRPTIGITVHGPPDTPWDRSLLHMLCMIPQDYPFRPPRMCFCTGNFQNPFTCERRSPELKAVPFHPNVHENGQLHLDILGHNWSPALVIPSVVRSCLLSLSECSEECILNQDAERVYRRSKEQWEKEARDRIEEDWRVD